MNKIHAGLEDALAYARGDKSRGRETVIYPAAHEAADLDPAPRWPTPKRYRFIVGTILAGWGVVAGIVVLALLALVG